MEFLNKRERLVLLVAAEKGKSGIEYNSLYSSLAILMTKDSIQKAIEELYLNGYISIVKIDNEVRVIVNRNVRKSLVLLEFYRSLIARSLQEIKKRLDDVKEEEQRRKILEETTQKLGIIVFQGLLSLASESPELTVPEFIESINTLKEPLQFLTNIFSQWKDKENLEVLIKLIAKYIGEEDSKVVAKLVENMLS